MGNGAKVQHDPLDITKKDCELKMEEIATTIAFHEREIKKLTAQRNMLMEKLKYLDIDLVLEYIVSIGLTSNEVLEIINKELEARRLESMDTITQ